MASKEKRVYINFVTPAGVAIFPKLNKPDTKFNADGAYSVKLAFAPEAIEAFIAKYTETLDEFEKVTAEKLLADKKTAKKGALLTRVEIGKPELNDDGEETGRTVINFKLNAKYTNKDTGKTTLYTPKLFDAKNKPTTVEIWGGSVLKVAGSVNPYYTPKDNEVGISFRLSGVQVIKLVTKGGMTAETLGFDEEEGGFEDDSSGGFEDAPAQDVPADAKPAKGADF